MKPTIKHFVAIALPYTIILISIYSVLPYYSDRIPVISYITSTTVWWTISYFIIILYFFSKTYYFEQLNEKNFLFIKIYLIWISICIVRGMFVAENYWDWKGLANNTMALLLPIVAYSATNKVIVQTILAFYVKYGLPLFIVLMLLIRTDAYGFFLMPVSFLLLFLPALSIRQRFVLLFFTAIILFADLGARSNVIKFALPLIVLTIYFLRDKLSSKTLEGVRLLFIIAPFVFLTLGITGIFNVFNMSDYLGEFKTKGLSNEGERIELDMSTDTRTFIYEEVIQSAVNNNYSFFGRTPARGNDSEVFGPTAFEYTGRDERLENEVGILNVFTWTGIVGVFLYLLIFYRATYLAINRSENIYAKMLGVYVAFRWLYSWVEDINSFSVNYFMLWIMLGLCFSYSFRSMTNYEVTLWVRGIFDNRYLDFEKYRKMEEDGK